MGSLCVLKLSRRLQHPGTTEELATFEAVVGCTGGAVDHKQHTDAQPHAGDTWRSAATQSRHSVDGHVSTSKTTHLQPVSGYPSALPGHVTASLGLIHRVIARRTGCQSTGWLAATLGHFRHLLRFVHRSILTDRQKKTRQCRGPSQGKELLEVVRYPSRHPTWRQSAYRQCSAHVPTTHRWQNSVPQSPQRVWPPRLTRTVYLETHGGTNSGSAMRRTPKADDWHSATGMTLHGIVNSGRTDGT